MRKVLVLLFVFSFVFALEFDRYLTPSEEGTVARGYPTISIDGKVSLKEITRLLLERGIEVSFSPDIPLDTALDVSVEEMPVDRFLSWLGDTLDAWVEFDGKRAKVEKTREFIFDADFIASVGFSIGRASQGGSGSVQGQGGGATGQGATGGGSLRYNLGENPLNPPKTPEMLWKDDNLGFVVMRLTPSQFRLYSKVFSHMEKKTGEMIHVRVDLVRIDLKKEFKYGIDWKNLGKNLVIGAAFPVEFGAGGVLRFAGNRLRSILSALETYGRVYKVDSWDFAGRTGKLLAFSNYKLFRYVNVTTTATQGTVLAQPQKEEDEVGFRGAFKVVPVGNRYAVEGLIDLSDVIDFTVFKQDTLELKYPNIEGKRVRVSAVVDDFPQTFLVGGFKVLNKSVTEEGVPVLSKIPLLGYLFKGATYTGNNSEFAFIITIDRYEEGIERGIKKRIAEQGDPLEMPYSKFERKFGRDEVRGRGFHEAVSDEYWD